MGPITEAMIRRRSEHNDGVLETLEELVLQEEGIDKIDMLSKLCPNLKQLFMPNNLISKIENLHRLRSLEYLNLTLNNISKVEGLQGCEMLTKLDLTLNFVEEENLPSVLNLCSNIKLEELFMTGNPCTDFPGYRKYVVAALLSLKRLDASTIKPSERIAALQDFDELQAEISQNWINADAVEARGSDLKNFQKQTPEVDEKGELLREYSATTRLAEHKEMQEMRAESERNSKAKSIEPKSKRRRAFDPLPTSGRIFQKNEGGWAFTLTESECGNLVVLDVTVGRYLDTSLIDVDLHPWWARVLVKGKLLQVQVPAEISPDKSFVQRSTTTGHLVVTCPKVISDAIRRQSLVSHGNNHPAVPHLKPKTNNKNQKQKPKGKAIKPDDKDAKDLLIELPAVDIHHIVKSESVSKPQAQLGDATDRSATLTDTAPTTHDVLDTRTLDCEVPPLE